MKLRNKLIPIASCLAIGATVAPMATACATSEFVDLKNGFTPTISRLAVEDYRLSAAKAEQAYFNAVSENPDIFVQDYNWTMSNLLRTAAENPDELFGDDQTSVIDYARQVVKNVKVGKTTIPYTYKDKETGLIVETEKDLYTLSFDYVREQQFTWKHDEYVVSSQPSTVVTTVGTTMMKMSVKNIPMNFNKYLEILYGDKLDGSLSFAYDEYNAHLGRGVITATKNAGILEYVPTQWFLAPALLIDWEHDAEVSQLGVLKRMTDPFEVTYEYDIADTNSYVYNDVETSSISSGHYDGKLNNENIKNTTKSQESILKELRATYIGSHYMSDIEWIVPNKK